MPSRPQWDLLPCGTPAAARRHWRRGEPLDEACRQASRRDRAERRGILAGADTPDVRERRNGLPVRLYVYRGSGRDLFDGTCLFDELAS